MLIAALSVAMLAAGTDVNVCTSASECEASGLRHTADRQYKEARGEFLRQVRLATAADDSDLLRTGLNHLALTALRLQRPREANAWIQVALARFAGDSLTLRTQRRVRQKLAGKTTSNWAGTYQAYAGFGRWSHLEIVERDRLLLRFDIVRYARDPEDWGVSASGELDADANRPDLRIATASFQGGDGTTCAFDLRLVDEGAIAVAWPTVPAPACMRWGGFNIDLDATYWKVEGRLER